MTNADLLSWLLTYGVHSTLLLGVAWLLTRWVVQSHAARDLVWKTALVGGLVTSTIQVGGWADGRLSGWGVRVAVGVPEAWQSADGERVKIAKPTEWGGARPMSLTPVGSGLTSLNEASGDQRSPASTLAPSEPATIATPGLEQSLTPSKPVASTVLLLWVAVAGALLLHFFLNRVRLAARLGRRRLLSQGSLSDLLESLQEASGLHRPIRLTCSTGVSSPVALGLSEICVPEAVLTDLEPEQQRVMLAHELAHLARLDPLWLDFGCLLERLFFFQPLNRMARRRIQDAAEYLCDDWAVHRTGSGLSLAKCLVKVAEWMDATPRAIPVSGMAEQRSQLVSRIHRLIENRAMIVSSKPRWLIPAGAVLLAATAAAAPGFRARNAASDQRPTPTLAPAAPISSDAAELQALGDTDTVSTVSEDGARQRVRMQERMELRNAMRSVTRIRMAPMAAMPHVAMVPHTPMPPMPAIAPMGWGPGHRHDGHQDTTSVAVPALVSALKDPDVEVRRAAVRALGNYEDIRALPGLVEALRDTDAEVRLGAAQSLGNLQDDRAVDGLVGALKDSNAEVRAAAIGALGELESSRSAAAVAAALKDEARDVRRAAAQAVSHMKGAHPVEPLIGALKDSDAEVRQAAAEGLGEMEDARAVRPLMALLTDASADVRQAAAQSLGQLHDPQAAEALSAAIKDGNADVRHAAIDALGELELTAAPQQLLDALKDPNRDVRGSAASAVGQMHDSRAVPALRTLLDDADPDVRENAIDALSEIRDRAALDALIGALKSKDPNVRKHAAQALGERQD